MRRQSGQAIVLAAVAMIALVAVLGLVLMGGLLYWERRQAQEMADAAALTAAQQLGAGCSAAQATAVIDAADSLLASHLGGGGNLTTTGDCTTQYEGKDGYGSGFAATIHYPYNKLTGEVEVIVTNTSGVQFAGILGTSQATVMARAVAQSNGGSLPGRYGLFAQNGITCDGGAPINVDGSVYSGATIKITGANCGLYAHDVYDSAGKAADYGDILVYDSSTSPQSWVQNSNGSPTCSPAASNAICSDGYEMAQVAGCPEPTGVTDYLDAGPPSNLSQNPDPCANGALPSVPQLTFQNFLPPEPNSQSPSAISTLPGGVACQANPLTPYSTYLAPNGKFLMSGNVAPPAAADSNGYYHFSPGCYGFIDVSQIPTLKAVLDPGFYYFNGSADFTIAPGAAPYTKGQGGGICLGSTGNLLAKDVTMEFVNYASFSSTDCGASPGGSCGTSPGCSFGSQPCSLAVPPGCPPAPYGDPGVGDQYNQTWFAAPCSSPTASPTPPTDNNACNQNSEWCKDSGCSGLLMWAPPNNYPKLNQICGSFYVLGSGELSWLAGTIFWPGGPEICGIGGANVSGCTYQANGTGTIAGELICDTATIQGGSQSTGTAITNFTSVKTKAPSEAALRE